MCERAACCTLLLELQIRRLISTAPLKPIGK
jgi:hypothetical protein